MLHRENDPENDFAEQRGEPEPDGQRQEPERALSRARSNLGIRHLVLRWRAD
jgi:hypothetical protein